MTVYNTARYLREAVESILTQTFTDFELIVIDDGSKDQSPAILREYAVRDPRVKVTSRPNTGVVRAAMEGIDRARGRYIARMDSDDRSLPERFARQVAYLDANPDCVLLGTRVMMMDPYGSPFGVVEQPLTHEAIEEQLLTSGGGMAVIQPSVMMRADAVRAAGGYRGDCNVGEDQDLFLRLAERGRVANLPDVLLWYRRHLRSLSRTQYQHMFDGYLTDFLRDAHARRGKTLPPGWKPTRWEPPSVDDQLRLWGWAALKAKNASIARKHAWAAIKAGPMNRKSWKLAICALRGR